MMNFTLDFDDIDPSLALPQTIECHNLDDAVADVIVAIRDIVADHVRHGKILTLRSIVIRDEEDKALKQITVADGIADLLPSLRDGSHL